MGNGEGPPRDIQTVVEIVRESKDPIVMKSLNDNNYTALETGWIGDSRHYYHHTDSRHHNRGFIPIDHLPENNEFEIRLKARHLIELHRVRGREITVAETHLPEDGYVPTYEQRSHTKKKRSSSSRKHLAEVPRILNFRENRFCGPTRPENMFLKAR